jgi:hypothetical protein
MHWLQVLQEDLKTLYFNVIKLFNLYFRCRQIYVVTDHS